MKKYLIIAFSIVLVNSCNSKQHHKVKVHRYKVSLRNNGGDKEDSFLYYYVLFGKSIDGNPRYFYYTNTKIITNFTNISFSDAPSKPFKQEQVEEEEIDEVSDISFAEEMQFDIDETLTETDIDTEADATDSSDASDSGGDGGD